MFFVSYVILDTFILFVGQYSSFASASEHEINVGTVLFNIGDNSRTCWDREGLTLLSSRYVFENVLPDNKLITMSSNSVVDDVVGYFRMLLEVVRASSNGRSRHLLILAMSDTIGGYLHRYVLPVSRYAYYNGQIKYDSIQKLYRLFTNVKDVLRTNGKGWAGALSTDYPSFSPKTLNIVDPRTTNTTEEVCKKFTSIITSDSGEISIPLPFTDYAQDPISLAVPIKGHAMVALTSKHSKNVLVKYYISSIQCMKSLNASDSNLKTFNSQLMCWLGKNILPHLHKETFYPAFGGVLQIVETMKGYGIKPNKSYLAPPPSKEVEEEEPEPPEQKMDLLIPALFATLIVWVTLGCIFVCCRMRTGTCPKEEARPRESSSSKPARSSTATSSTAMLSNKSRRTYGSSSSLESRKKSDIHKKRRSDKKKFICYMEAKEGFPPLQKAKSKKSIQTTPSFDDISKSANTASESKRRSLREKSVETFGLTSTSTKTSREEGVVDYQTETTSTTSETTVEEEEDERNLVR